MRFLALLLACVAAVVADPQQIGINDQFKSTIESFKSLLKCGFPLLGIPPMAPFIYEQGDFAIENSLLSVAAGIQNLRIDGIDDYDVEKAEIDLWGTSITANINLKEFGTSAGKYFVDLLALNKLNFTGAGDLLFKIQDLRVENKLKLGLTFTGLTVKDYEMKITLGSIHSNITGLFDNEVTSDLVNSLAGGIITKFVNSKTDYITEQVRKIVVPILDSVVSRFNWWDLIGWITGGWFFADTECTKLLA